MIDDAITISNIETQNPLKISINKTTFSMFTYSKSTERFPKM